MPHALTELKLTSVTKPAGDPGHEIRADVCVVGAGIAGLSAAIEAAQLGRDVVLLDSLPVIGGQMVNSLIGLFCGVFGNAPRHVQLTHGIFDDIFRDLGPSGDLHFQRGHTTTVYYNEVALGRWLERRIIALGVRTILGTVLQQVDARDGRVERISLASRYGNVSVTAAGFVDASGDAALTWAAGLPCWVPERPIYGSQQVIVEGVDERHKAFGEARVRAYGYPGRRQTRWIKGRHQLTLDEVRAGTRFGDAVARTAWPIELHDRADGYVWETFEPDHVHYVPLRSMTPPGAHNVMAAGRCIDGDAAALSSVRVMGPCAAMGAAAAHALDLADGGSTHDIDLDRLHDRLAPNLGQGPPVRRR
jgi:hypothetical protein